MLSNAQTIFKELDAGVTRPFYLIVGEEPFQVGEIFTRLKRFFVADPKAADFQFELWDGENLNARDLMTSLEMMPGLFDDGGKRLIACGRFEKASAAALEILQPYWANPIETTSFLMLATKVDKRKAWYKQVDEKGIIVEVNEPYDRDWPKWQAYFEKKIGKRMDARAWERLVAGASRTLSLVWADVQKLAVYVGEKNTIALKDVEKLFSGGGGVDVFDFAEQVLHRDKYPAFRMFHSLVESGESEIKLLSILVRQFRQVDNCLRLQKEGITDPKRLAPQIGVHPFFIPKILAQAKHQSPSSISAALNRLADCDYHLKLGQGSLFQDFLIPYFRQH